MEVKKDIFFNTCRSRKFIFKLLLYTYFHFICKKMYVLIPVHRIHPVGSEEND